MTTIHGFTLTRETDIPELNVHVRIFRHDKTGADLLSLENDDENKVFGASFRTPPADSTGIAHIMEHSVLGGSEKYPLKEPFVQLIKGSLKTFLNAFTSPDKTTYPVASTNLQDFYNLVDVYLDAVFHPLITPHHLDQEGWHYELESVDAPLVYKGVVFNEMKGAYSSPDSMLYRAGQQALFPDNAYGYDSGGDPRVIPDLTYEHFRSFHETYYHPSNARLFFYGDDDPTERLRLLDNVLKQFDARPVDGTVTLQQPFDAPRRIIESYGVDDDEAGESGEAARKTMTSVGWMLPEDDNPELTMALGVLSYALVSTQASPLRKRLLDSGLGEDVIGGGLGTGLRQMTFRTGLKGMASEDVDTLEQLILDSLSELADQGFESEMIEAAVNTIEFSLRENNSGSYPRGLMLFMRSLSTWLYDQDPLAPLAFEAPLAAVKQRLDDNPAYLQELIRIYLLDNPHRVTVVMEPDPDYNRRLEDEERQRLDAARAQMDEAERQAIVDNTLTLKRLQETPDSPELLATLPSLQLSDLDKDVNTIPIEVLPLENGKILYHDLFTNGIVYLILGFDMHVLPQELLPYADFFGKALTRLGTETEDYVKLSQRIGRKTGGIYASDFISSQVDNPEATAWLTLQGKATMDQAPAMLEIMRDILLTVRLDNRERFLQIVLETKARMEASLVPSGHSYVNSRLRASFSEAAWVNEQLGGIAYLSFVRKMAAQVENDWPGVLAKLEEVRTHLVGRNGVIANVTLDQANWQAFEPQLRQFVGALPFVVSKHASWTPDRLPANEGLSIPAQVNYVGKGANLYELGYEYDGSINVISNLVRTGWLWDKIRAQGGAYGAFCSFGKHTGVWSFLSYRDPNLLGTLDNYDQTAAFLRSHQLSDDELTKAIIGSIGSMDAYQLPDAKGFTSMTRYLTGETDERRQHARDGILGTSREDFVRFADILDQANAVGRVVVMGSADALAAANEELDDMMTIQKAM